jgi:hypothetical protein
MFKVNPNPEFTCPVQLSVPGEAKPRVVHFVFRHKDKLQLRAWHADALGKSDAALLDELIVSWSGMVGEDGADVPYSITALEDIITKYWPAREEITDAYLNELRGSKAKNS